VARKHRRSSERAGRNVTHLAHGGAQRVSRQGGEWFVRQVSAQRAEKSYRCPDCGGDIRPGQAHVVAWRADHLFGDASAVQDRRHFHTHCWRLA